jgi:hypothetical protein
VVPPSDRPSRPILPASCRPSIGTGTECDCGKAASSEPPAPIQAGRRPTRSSPHRRQVVR